ncbi:shieldin complex subunit 2 [Solea solea]|uniref:shieldin complex subunit 2 n=1 Tax=Solea solea TaxID=90069 RepID=UPI00272B42B9|nr:shieldin complex subunit 2 [Solea solea]
MEIMCERQKIHVFLGAPPSFGPGLVSEAGQESEAPPPAGWRHLELTWRGGRLRPATGSDEVREERVRTSSDYDAVKILCSNHREPPEILESLQDQSGPEKEDQCFASVHEYLNSCFPDAQPEPEPEPEPSHHKPTPAHPPLCTDTQFLATWTLSQALILRGSQNIQLALSPEKAPPPQTPPKQAKTPPAVSSSTPELFSPVTPSPGASAELFSQICLTPPRVTKGGVVLEATAGGVLCSQEAETTTNLHSPTKCPSVKKPRKSEAPTSRGTAALRCSTTPLVQCLKPGPRFSVLVAVVHPCHLKEVKVRSGPSAGTFVPLASIVVTDESDVEMKVVLWRRAAFWALTVSPGDVLLITGLQVNEDKWRGETVLQSTFSSKLLSLGQITVSTSPPAPQQVDAHSLSRLCSFLRERRPLLVSVCLRPPQDLNRLPYATLRSLSVNTLVHALLRVTHTHLSTEWRGEAESRCRSAVQLKAVVTVEQPGGQQGALLLWGAAVEWLPRFSADKVAVWDFHFLLVRDSLTSDLLELHSTPWSSAHRLDPTDRRLRDFLAPRHSPAGDGVELDVDTLLSQKYSGVVELRVQVAAFSFQNSPSSQNAPRLLMDSSTPLDGVLEALSGDATYAGCGRCSAELSTDTNGIYSPCYPCLPLTGVRRYYRPGVLTVSGRGYSQLCVLAPPVPLQKILEAPPDKLHRSSAPGSQVKLIQVAAERLHALLSLPKKTFVITIRSHFLCDENSAPLSQDFTLLDLQLPTDRK